MAEMTADERSLLRDLLTARRVLALAVQAEDSPYIGQLPFAMMPDFRTALIHASRLARHSRGLRQDAPFAALVQEPDDGHQDPFRLARVSLQGTVAVLPRESPVFPAARGVFLAKLPSGSQMFGLGDFTLYALRIERARFVAGFGRTLTVSLDELERLSGA